jgi:hypothetical protein
VTLKINNQQREAREEEEDLFVFNDTVEGPRAPAVKAGLITQASQVRAPLSPVVGQSDCARCGRLTIFLPRFGLRHRR